MIIGNQEKMQMSKPRAVNKHHKIPYDVYIGRGSIWETPLLLAKMGIGMKLFVNMLSGF